MNFKKLLVTLLAAALLLSSCGKTDETIGEGSGTTDITITDENTTEENAGTTEAAGIIASADDVVAFLDNDVYSQCPADSLPMMLMSIPLAMDDMEGVTYHTGLADVDGITDIILSESGVGSIAYSLVYLRTDGTKTADIQKTLGESINPRKWVCVGAEYIASVTLDNDVCLIMGSKDQVDMVMDAVLTAAEGKFNNIGSVVTFG
ncbi:MAG: hypothetical protein IJB20_00475 [Clostridia bacterium]|nr:hypothetical protein [Clostridia bacterium]